MSCDSFIFVSKDPIGNDDGILLSNSLADKGLYIVLLLQQYLDTNNKKKSVVENMLVPCFVI